MERLGRLDDVGEVVRERMAAQIASAPTAVVFVNLHANDLLSDSLYVLIVPSGPLMCPRETEFEIA